MAVFPDNKNDNHILLLNRIDIKNILNLPLKATQRIKYTCFDISQNFIILGASSGGLYVFRRQPCEFIQLLPNKEGSVTQVVISKDEDLIAFGTQKGIVCILQRNENGIGAKLLNKSTEHLGHEITVMEWTSKNQLYFGDCNGKVTSIYVSLFVRKAIFQTPPYTMIELDSRVVQIDSSDDILVISTLTKCYVCDMSKEQFKQIGQKPRDGDFGCCIAAWNEKKIFSARPGSRIWEVELSGIVKSTHQLKYCLAIPPTLNVCSQETLDNNLLNISGKSWPPQSLNFKKLHNIWENCLLTYTSKSIFILDMLKINVLLWCDGYNNIQNVKYIEDTIYIWSSNGELIVEKIIPLQNFLVSCYDCEDYDKCIMLIEHYYDRIMKISHIIDYLYPLVNVGEKVDLPVNTNNLISKIKKTNYLKQQFFKLPSGIYSLKNYIYVKKNYRLKRSYSLMSLKSDKSILRSKSMLNIHISLEKIKKSEQYPSNDYSKLNDKHIFDQLYMELNIPSIPFVSLATSDVFHDTLMEIGSNVTNKIVQSSKTLKDTLNNLTASTSKNDLIPYEVSDFHRRSELPVNENEVDVSSYKLDLEHREKLNLLPIMNICKKLQNGYSLDVDCLQCLVSGVLEVKSNLENVLQINQSSFPFHQYLKEKHLNTIKKAVNSSFANNLVSKWAEKYAKDTLVVNTFDYPEFLTYYLSDSDFKRDMELSEFITLFVQVIEVGDIFEFLLNDNLKCSYAIFCKILKMSSNNDRKTEVPLLMYLNSMYVFLKLDQIESFRTLGYKRNIKPIFVFYLIMKFSVHLKTNSQEKCNAIFLSYLSYFDENIFNDCNIFYFAVYSFAALKNETKHLCKCGFPLGNIDGKFKKLGKILIEYLSTYTNLEQLHKILHTFITCDSTVHSLEDVIKCFCKQVPHLWSIVLESSLKLNDSKNTQVILSIHLGLLDQLDLHLNDKNKMLFDKVFALNYYFKRGLCLNCGNVGEKNQGIEWTDLAALAFQYLSSEEIRYLLHKHKDRIPRGEIDCWFYQSCILTDLVGTNLKKPIIQTLKHHNNISTMGIESCKNLSIAWEKDIGTTVQLKNLYSKKSHWGTRIDIKNGYCIWCSLPLNSEPLIRGKYNGLVSFKCGHSFHTVCIRHQTDNIQCAVCQRK